MVKLAIVGLGYWGPNLLRNFDQLRDCEVLFCCDLNDANLRSVKEQYPHVQTTKDYDALVVKPQLDAIVIATSAVTHYGLAKKALLQNKHVFVEKPLTMNYEHAVELVELAERVDRKLMVSVYTKVTLEDNVFCGPSAVFTNVLNPRAEIHRPLDEYLPTLVKEGAAIGANATIVCGHTIGRYAFIGAGAVVTKDIPDYALVYGNAATIAGWMCECGKKLVFRCEEANPIEYATCFKCEKRYEKMNFIVKRVE